MPTVVGTFVPATLSTAPCNHSVRPLAAIASMALAGSLSAGTFTNYNGGSGPDAPIAVSSITRWATVVTDYSPAPGVGPNFRNPSASSGIFSLGDLYSTTAPPAVGTEPSSFHAGSGTANFHPYGGNVADTSDTYGFIGVDAPGSVTFYYDSGIYNGPGADLAVRENGSGSAAGFFAEFAFVEVSSNGTDFARFPSISLNAAPTSTIGQFQYYDMTNVYNLAGKHASNLATPFDFQDLLNDAMVVSGTVDLSAITYIRLVDVVGNPASSGPVGALDSQGNRILDNWTTYDSSGFDVVISGGLPQAVGILNGIVAIPEPALIGLLVFGVMPLLRRTRRSIGN